MSEDREICQCPTCGRSHWKLSSSPPVAQHTATSEWRDLLVACQCAMATATARYRISFNLPGDSQDVAGWVHELDKLQKQIFEVLKGDTDAR